MELNKTWDLNHKLIQNKWVATYTTKVEGATMHVPDTMEKDGVTLALGDAPIDCRGAKGIIVTIDGSDVDNTSTDAYVRIISSYDNIDIPVNFDDKYQDFSITATSIITYQLSTPINWIKIRVNETQGDPGFAKPIVTVVVDY